MNYHSQTNKTQIKTILILICLKMTTEEILNPDLKNKRILKLKNKIPCQVADLQLEEVKCKNK